MGPTSSSRRSWALLGLAVIALAGLVNAADQDTRIVQAAKRDDAAAVQSLIRARADVSAAEADGSTALLWAAYHQNVDLAKALIKAGAKVNAANRYGMTPLLQASRFGTLPIIEALLAAGANVQTAQAEGETPLMAAAAAGSVEAVRLFIARGAAVDAKETAADQTALMWAANEGHLKVVETLIEAGANPNAVGRVVNLPRLPQGITGGRMWADYTSGGLTSLMFAARHGHEDVTRRLLTAGANPNVANPDGLTALIIAIINDQIDTAMVLVEGGADANDGSLFEAVGVNNMRTNETVGEATRPRPRNLNKARPTELIARLLDKGADPMRPATHVLHGDKTGIATAANQSAFARALGAQDVESLKLMVGKGVNVNLVNAQGTPLMTLVGGGGGRFGGGFGAAPAGFRYAGTRSILESARVLLDAGADVNAARATGETALHLAAQAGNAPLIQLLADKGAKLDAKTNDGATALDYATGAAGGARGGGRGGGGGGGGAAGPGGPRGGGAGQQEAAALLRQLMGLPAAPAAQTSAAPPAGPRGGN